MTGAGVPSRREHVVRRGDPHRHVPTLRVAGLLNGSQRHHHRRPRCRRKHHPAGDVVVTTAAAPPADVTPPAVTARTPAAGATGVAVTTAVSATFNEALATPLPTVAMTGAGVPQSPGARRTTRRPAPSRSNLRVAGLLNGSQRHHHRRPRCRRKHHPAGDVVVHHRRRTTRGRHASGGDRPHAGSWGYRGRGRDRRVGTFNEALATPLPTVAMTGAGVPQSPGARRTTRRPAPSRSNLRRWPTQRFTTSPSPAPAMPPETSPRR